ncbi:MAG: hypothetical protein HY319_01290 [Armatimonadetes bacterium]|nr:hypothetical protein [Armatimonadota bacterium]
MKVLSKSAPAASPLPRPRAEAPGDEPRDVAELSFLGKIGRGLLRVGKSAALVAAPAAATAIAMSTYGPNGAGMTLAGDMIGAGTYSTIAFRDEGEPGQVFCAGAFLGLFSGALGMVGPEGVAIMAALGATGQVIAEVLDATGS